MKLKSKVIIFCTLAIILMLGSLIICDRIYNETYIQTSTKVTSSTELSNQKIGWGIKRAKNHQQPDLGSGNLKLLREYDGIAIGNNEEKSIYLTFDNGYEAGYTNKILDTLKENQVTATFFITAHYLNTASDLVDRMIKEGHIVGNHTVNHKSMPEITDEEIEEEVMKLHYGVYEKFRIRDEIHKTTKRRI